MAWATAIFKRVPAVSQVCLAIGTKHRISFRNNQFVVNQELPRWQSLRLISLGIPKCDEATEVEEVVGDETAKPKRVVDPEKDRSIKILPEVSLKYMESSAYQETYGDDVVWKHYRRNHKHAFAPRKTRKTCIRMGAIATGSPCPICRDEYLVLDYTNVKLLKQFISPYSNEVMDAYYTGLCQKRQYELLIAVEKARDLGLITFYVPKRYYNYDDYYPRMENSENKNC